MSSLFDSINVVKPDTVLFGSVNANEDNTEKRRQRNKRYHNGISPVQREVRKKKQMTPPFIEKRVNARKRRMDAICP